MLKISAILSVIVTALIAVGMVLTLSAEASETQATEINITPTTVVYGPAPVQADLYVCHTPSTSTEYLIDPSTDWSVLQTKSIRIVWNMSDISLDLFKADVALFQRYTNLDIEVVEPGYVPQPNDFMVNTILADGTDAAAMGVASDTYTVAGLLHPVSADLYFYRPWFGNAWGDLGHTHIVLHELGHLMGLDHTHDAPGEQVDSVMSYESHRSGHYLPGDIAGLKILLCK